MIFLSYQQAKRYKHENRIDGLICMWPLGMNYSADFIIVRKKEEKDQFWNGSDFVNFA